MVAALQVLGVLAVLAGIVLAFPLAVALVVDGVIVLVVGVALEMVNDTRKAG